MGEYLSPGVFVESVNKANAPIEAVSASIGGFVGITPRGPVGKAVLVTSWQNFLDTFAYGLETPFLKESDLAYSVYGFFQNGGTKCYVIRVASKTAKKATSSSNVNDLTLTAKEEGTWGNKITVAVVGGSTSSKNGVYVKYDGEEVEYFESWSEAKDSKFFDITGDTDNAGLTLNTLSFEEGADGITDLVDADYISALEAFNYAEDVNLICVPGQVSETMTKGIIAYAEKRGNVFAILDGEKSADLDAIKTFRGKLSCKYGALYYPWIKVSDPLSKTGELRDCPTCGHIMGIYARTIQERGVWKAPAGVEATVRGAIDVVKVLNKGECDTLNPLSINVIMPRKNYGIVAWGARSLNPDATMKYVSDILLKNNIMVSVENGTQWAVFEPNNSTLWARVKTSIETFLYSIWKDGGLAGESANQAYFVKCDEELNPESVRNAGKLICEVGYAPNKPAEFVIIRIAHSISE